MVWIADLDALSPSLARQIEDELAKREFVPVVRRILKVSAPVEPSEWEVETDRGPRRFTVDQEDHVRPLEDGRHLISDSHGMRYLVPKASELDLVSRKLLARFS